MDRRRDGDTDAGAPARCPDASSVRSAFWRSDHRSAAPRGDAGGPSGDHSMERPAPPGTRPVVRRLGRSLLGVRLLCLSCTGIPAGLRRQWRDRVRQGAEPEGIHGRLTRMALAPAHAVCRHGGAALQSSAGGRARPAGQAAVGHFPALVRCGGVRGSGTLQVLSRQRLSARALLLSADGQDAGAIAVEHPAAMRRHGRAVRHASGCNQRLRSHAHVCARPRPDGRGHPTGRRRGGCPGIRRGRHHSRRRPCCALCYRAVQPQGALSEDPELLAQDRSASSGPVCCSCA